MPLLCVSLTACDRPKLGVHPVSPHDSPHRSRERPPFSLLPRPAALYDGRLRIREECQQAADDDWNRWQAQTAKYRHALRIKTLSLGPSSLSSHLHPSESTRLPTVLEGTHGFPLYQIDPGRTLIHVYSIADARIMQLNPAVVAIRKLFHDRGVDLILVPVPAMAQIYIEQFVQPCPPDGVIGPHLRLAILQLLESDVETLDTFRLLRSNRFPGVEGEYLYHAADPYWTPRTLRIIANELRPRIARYGRTAHAGTGAPIYRVVPRPYGLPERTPPSHVEDLTTQIGWRSLTESQMARARQVEPRIYDHVVSRTGDELPDDDKSPVVLIGDGNVINLREQLVQELNMLIRIHQLIDEAPNSLTERIMYHSLADNAQVAVWLIPESTLLIANSTKSQPTLGD